MILLEVFSIFLFFPKLLAIAVFKLNFVKANKLREEPKVSILIPARNESENLAACLQSLLAQDYPSDSMEILVGNDQSNDDTGEIASSFAAEHKTINVHDIEADYHGLVARSNVLAQLAKKASGEFLVFLDADMVVAKQWLKDMVAPATNGYDLVSGFTEVKANGWFSRVQQMDWLNMIFLLKIGADLGMPATALGNNMLVSRKAYDEVGGYEAIGPTYTEDNDLTLALRKKKFSLYQLLNNQVAYTLPVHNFESLLEQRMRWLHGAFRQPLWKLLPLLFIRVAVLWALLLSFWDIRFGFAIMLQLGFWETIISLFTSAKSKTKVRIHIAFFAPVFNSLLDTFTLLSYPWNRKVTWKGRKL